MANDFIKINRLLTTATEAQNLLSVISQWRAATAAVLAMRNRMQHMTDGSTFATLEGLCGLEDGQGQNAFALLDGTVSAITGSGYATDLQNKIG